MSKKAGSSRVIFVDLARAVAVLLMVQGHTFDALLAPAFREGFLYQAWLFQRGLTSCLFLMLSGFAFSIATSRHWTNHVTFAAPFLGRVRRFAFFVFLGYVLHLPARLHALASATDEGWRDFFRADVLQCIGMALIGLQLLVWICRTEARYVRAAFGLSAVVALASPWIWSVEWTRWLPLPVATYLSPAWGSFFPLFPWAAYLLLGAALGLVYSRWDGTNLPAFTSRLLLPLAAGCLGAGVAASWLPAGWLGPTLYGSHTSLVLVRVGSVLLFLAGVSWFSRRLSRLPHAYGALAQESLLVYFVHLCIVYGSVWNQGFQHHLGATLPPGSVYLYVVLLWATMTLLAWTWNWCKHAQPSVATVVRRMTGGILVLLTL